VAPRKYQLRVELDENLEMALREACEAPPRQARTDFTRESLWKKIAAKLPEKHGAAATGAHPKRRRRKGK